MFRYFLSLLSIVALLDFTVQLDSGSSDLWILPGSASLKLTNDSGLYTDIFYGEGAVGGNIQFAELKLGEYTIPSQGQPEHCVLFVICLDRLYSFPERQPGE